MRLNLETGPALELSQPAALSVLLTTRCSVISKTPHIRHIRTLTPPALTVLINTTHASNVAMKNAPNTLQIMRSDQICTAATPTPHHTSPQHH